MLKLNNVSKYYSKQNNIVKALDGVSCSVQPGEFVAIVGASGSGKTTLLLSAGGLLRPDEGEILFESQDVYEKSPDERALFRSKNIGFVFQQYHLIPYLTVLENVLMPGLAAPDAGLKDRAQELLENFGLKKRLYHTPAELSAGEKQRTALARALLFNPKILFADEITGNLDQANSNIVLDCLEEYTQAKGAVLLVTHDQDAAKRADRILYLENGVFEIKGTLHE